MSNKVLSDFSRQNKDPNKILIDNNYYNYIIITIFPNEKNIITKRKRYTFSESEIKEYLNSRIVIQNKYFIKKVIFFTIFLIPKNYAKQIFLIANIYPYLS